MDSASIIKANVAIDTIKGAMSQLEEIIADEAEKTARGEGHEALLHALMTGQTFMGLGMDRLKEFNQKSVEAMDERFKWTNGK